MNNKFTTEQQTIIILCFITMMIVIASTLISQLRQTPAAHVETRPAATVRPFVDAVASPTATADYKTCYDNIPGLNGRYCTTFENAKPIRVITLPADELPTGFPGQ